MAITITLKRNANRNNALLGRFPNGDAPPIEQLTASLFEYAALSTPQVLTLHPTGAAATGSQIRVNFTIPFPRGALNSVNDLVITDDLDNEIATHVELIAPWRDLTDNSTGTVRSARVWMNRTFADTSTQSLRFKTGTRTLELGAQTNYKADWVDHSTQPANEYNDEYTTLTVLEPLAYATCTAEWLCSCNLVPRMEPLAGTFAAGGGSFTQDDIRVPEWAWDETSLAFAKTVVNDVGAHVTTYDVNARALVDYENAFEPWLYDRAAFLYCCYIRTGDVKWLRHAVRASQFYGQHIGVTGYFDLRADDIKYSYSLSPMLCAFLAGDTDQDAVMQKTVLPTRSGVYNSTYQTGSLWTERNFAYMIEAELCYWEYSGDATAYANAKTLLQEGIDQVASPYDSSAPNGTIKHQMIDHEGGPGNGDGSENIFSPWMSNLMFMAYFRAYMLSEDLAYAEFIAGYGAQYESAFYTGTFDSQTVRVPWYIAGEQLFSDGGVWGDIEHVCDTLNAMNLILWAQEQAGLTISTTLQSFATEMKPDAGINQSYWYRNGQATIDAGYTIWRVAPHRRALWQHGKQATKWLESSRSAA